MILEMYMLIIPPKKRKYNFISNPTETGVPQRVCSVPAVADVCQQFIFLFGNVQFILFFFILIIFP